jgi:hypothetical protein
MFSSSITVVNGDEYQDITKVTITLEDDVSIHIRSLDHDK